MVRKMENEVMNVMLLKVASLGRRHLYPGVLKQRQGPLWRIGFGVNRKDLLEEPRWSVLQSWDSSQVEDELEEGDAMDWLEDDEMVRQGREVGNEEER